MKSNIKEFRKGQRRSSRISSSLRRKQINPSSPVSLVISSDSDPSSPVTPIDKGLVDYSSSDDDKNTSLERSLVVYQPVSEVGIDEAVVIEEKQVEKEDGRVVRIKQPAKKRRIGNKGDKNKLDEEKNTTNVLTRSSSKVCIEKIVEVEKETKEKDIRRTVVARYSPKAKDVVGKIMKNVDGKKDKELKKKAVSLKEKDMKEQIVPSEVKLEKGSKRAAVVYLEGSDLKKIKSERPPFVSKSVSLGITEMVKTFNSDQKLAVISMGFGGLLDMKVKSVNLSIAKWMVDRFNGVSRILDASNGEFIQLTAEDYCDVFQLPISGFKVVSYKRNDEQPEAFTRFKNEYGLTVKSTVKDLRNILTSVIAGQSGDNFKILFALYCLSSFFVPRGNYTVVLPLLKTLLDVQNIGKYDWSAYCFNKLCNSIHKYHTESKIHLRGCLLAFTVIYLHRLNWRGTVSPTTLPLIKHWTSEKIMERVLEEKKSGSFGNGFWVKDVYPITKKVVICETEKKEKEDIAPEVGVRNDDFVQNIVDEINSEGVGLYEEVEEKDGRYIKFGIPKGLQTNEDIKKSAKDNFHEIFMLMKRDMGIVFDHYMHSLKGLKDNVPKVHQVHYTDSQEEDRFWSNEEVLKIIDAACERMNQMMKMSDDMPNFELLSSSKVNTPVQAKFNIFDDDQTVNIGLSGEVDESIREAIKSVEKCDRPNGFYDPLTLSTCVIAERTDFVSSFMTQNKRFFVNSDLREKQIIDFCMFDVDDFYDGEMVMFMLKDADEFPCYVFKKDLISMNMKRWVFCNIIDAWTVILNKEQKDGKRVFLNLSHCAYLDLIMTGVGIDVSKMESNVRDSFKQSLKIVNVDAKMAEMIFVPINIREHYYCIVLNFNLGKVQVIDNRDYDDRILFEPEIQKIYQNIAKTVHKLLVKFVRDINHPKAGQVAKYTIEFLKLNGQNNSDGNDCGIFLMYNMEFFDGENVSSDDDISKGNVRRLLRAKYLMKVVLHPINNVKEILLGNVVEFCKNKAQLKFKLEEKKKNAGDLKKKEKLKK